MAKAVKFINNNFLDSSGVIHNRKKLSDVLNNLIKLNTGSIKYITLDEKIMIMLGKVTNPRLGANQGGSVRVTFPKSFKNTDYFCFFDVSAGNSMWSWVRAYAIRYTGYMNVSFWNNGGYEAYESEWNFMCIGEI